MSSPTKIIKKLPVDQNTLERFRKSLFLQKVAEAVKGIENTLVKLPSDVWMRYRISNDVVYLPKSGLNYEPLTACLVPVFRDYNVRAVSINGEFSDRDTNDEYSMSEIHQFLKIGGKEGQLPTPDEALKIFRRCLNGYIHTSNNDQWRGVVCKNAQNNGIKHLNVYASTQGVVQSFNDTNGYAYIFMPVLHLRGVNSEEVSGVDALLLWLQNGIEPQLDFWEGGDQAEAYKKALIFAKENGHLLCVENDRIAINEKQVVSDLLAGKTYDFIKFDVKAVLSSTDLPADDIFLSAIKKDLLTCDKRRAALDPYDERLLTDPNRGHWDLWDKDETAEEDGGMADLGEGLVARDPATDINEGFVAIDFGTKSTVVVYESGPEMHMPLQVGSGTYSQGFEAKNYENPTIVHFLDIPAFETAYRAREGRPATSWETMTVSHTAKSDLDSNTTTSWYASFFDQLKQWCGAKNQRVKIRDTAGNVLDLPAFMELADVDFNPIEVYAYYLGIYMNNMLGSRLFLRYILSFPVTYEIAVREKIRRSFERGLKKSLPTGLLANEEAMAKFSVQEGANEPAAYAITALRSFGFEPEGEEQDYYAVFDFGGGTTDFDFGRMAESEKDRYDATLTHFGANGDRTLGGENLLRLLAFEVFQANADLLRHPRGKDGDTDEKIPFTLAADGRASTKLDTLIKQSQEAQQNMHNLMEKLRPVWEAPHSKDAQSILNQGIVRVNLFTDKDDENNEIPNVELKLQKEDGTPLDLWKILRDRIEDGVRKFFISMKEAFAAAAGEGSGISPLANVSDIAIFLAGNSSKSRLVSEIFQSYIGGELPEEDEEEETGAELSDIGDTSVNDDDDDNKERPAVSSTPATESAIAEKSAPVREAELKELLGLQADQALPEFRLFPPLGTKAADALVTENPVPPYDPSEEPPTAKTGVAYGLLDSRRGAKIQVIDLSASGSKIAFQYYVGRNKRRRFHMVINENTPMQKWYRFIDASDDFDILYTDNPQAATNKAPAQIAKQIHIEVAPEQRDEARSVYIRPVAARAIEYMIAANEEELENPMEGQIEPVRLELD